MNQKFISRSILLIISIYSLLASCTKEVDYGSLVERNGIKYEVNSDKGYTGNSVGFHENGQKSIQSSFVDGKLDGGYKEWLDNGQLKVQCSYSDGVLIDSLNEYFHSGQLKKQCNYSNGLLDGHYEEYWGNGTRKISSHYSNGKKLGEYLRLNDEGGITEKTNYLNDSLHGKSERYWEANILKFSGNYSHGEAINEHLTYFANEHLEERILYDSLGNKLEREWYFAYKQDTLLHIYSYTNNFQIVEKVYEKSGRLRRIIEDSTDLGINYKRERHYADGLISREKFNDLNEWVYYFSDAGKLERKVQWNGGKGGYEWDGRYYEYHESGKVKISGYYKKGKQAGTWKHYDADGSLKFTDIW
jgi:uncharacterized protein